MPHNRAIFMVAAAMMAFALQDVAVKLVAPEISLWQMQLVRSTGVLALIAMVATTLGRGHELTPRGWRWPMLRGLLMIVAFLSFYAALPYVSLAKAASVFFVSPILITVLAAIFLGEPIGPRRLVAVAAGFAGVLFIVRPGFDGWDPMVALPLVGAMAYAAAVVLTRWRCREDPGFSLTVVANLWFALAGILGLILLPFLPLTEATRAEYPFLTAGWQPLSGFAFGLLMATAATHVTGVLLTIRAYQGTEASRLAPVEYSYLVAMGILDFAIWRILPDQATLAGMVLICAGGAFVAWREGRPARPLMQQTAEIPWSPDHDEASAEWTDPGAAGTRRQ